MVRFKELNYDYLIEEESRLGTTPSKRSLPFLVHQNIIRRASPEIKNVVKVLLKNYFTKYNHANATISAIEFYAGEHNEHEKDIKIHTPLVVKIKGVNKALHCKALEHIVKVTSEIDALNVKKSKKFPTISRVYNYKFDPPKNRNALEIYSEDDKFEGTNTAMLRQYAPALKAAAAKALMQIRSKKPTQLTFKFSNKK